jgi:hypothetical protein
VSHDRPRRLLEQAIEAEVEAFLATMKDLKLAGTAWSGMARNA